MGRATNQRNSAFLISVSFKYIIINKKSVTKMALYRRPINYPVIP